MLRKMQMRNCQNGLGLYFFACFAVQISLKCQDLYRYRHCFVFFFSLPPSLFQSCSSEFPYWIQVDVRNEYIIVFSGFPYRHLLQGV